MIRKFIRSTIENFLNLDMLAPKRTPDLGSIF